MTDFTDAAKKKKKKKQKNFIQKAIKKPGSLHKALGVKKGEKIPLSKLKAAAKKPGKTGQRARFALNVLRPAAQKRKKKSTKRKRK